MKLLIYSFMILSMLAMVYLSGCSGCRQVDKESTQDQQLRDNILHHDHHHAAEQPKKPEAPKDDPFWDTIIFPITPPYRPDGHFRYLKDPFPVPEFVRQYPEHFTVDERGFWHIQIPVEKKVKLGKLTSDLTKEEHSEKIIEIVSAGLDTCTSAVFVLNMGGLQKEARSLFEKAISENPDDFYALYYWSGMIESERPQEAEAINRKLVTLRPDSLIALHGLGSFIAHIQPEPHEAIPYLEEAYRLNPDWHGPIFSLGVAYYRLRDYEKALKYLQASEVFTGPTDVSSALIAVIQSTSNPDETQGENK